MEPRSLVSWIRSTFYWPLSLHSPVLQGSPFQSVFFPGSPYTKWGAWALSSLPRGGSVSRCSTARVLKEPHEALSGPRARGVGSFGRAANRRFLSGGIGSQTGSCGRRAGGRGMALAQHGARPLLPWQRAPARPAASSCAQRLRSPAASSWLAPSPTLAAAGPAGWLAGWLPPRPGGGHCATESGRSRDCADGSQPASRLRAHQSSETPRPELSPLRPAAREPPGLPRPAPSSCGGAE